MSVCNDNCTNMEIFYEMMSDEMWTSWGKFADYFVYQPWVFSLLGSALVGLSGIFPMFIIPVDVGADLKHGAGAATLKILLSFAVGGLLGDVFLHLLPEAWGNKVLNIKSTEGHPSMLCGLWVLGGFLVFIIAEKIFIGDKPSEDEDCDSMGNTEIQTSLCLNNNQNKEIENNNSLSVMNDKIRQQERFSNLHLNETRKNGCIIRSISADTRKNSLSTSGELSKLYSDEKIKKINANNVIECNGFVRKLSLEPMNASCIVNDNINGIFNEKESKSVKVKAKHISGYLNLLANCIDNFTHGLAVGGSFLVSFRLGALTTFAILIHEIPHEVGDFAILLKSGFNRWDAARAQLMTASGGIFGALMAVLCSGSGVESRTSWILPFTAGGFLHIGLVTILPELLKESNPKESIKQLGALLSGIIVMALLTILCD